MAPTTNGHHEPTHQPPQSTKSPPKREIDTEDMSDTLDGTPPKKKRKPSLDADALYAAKLQAEENMKARPTRGGTTRKAAPVKKKRSPKKKTAARVKASDDSDVDESETGEPRPPKNTGFHVRNKSQDLLRDRTTDAQQKPLTLSAPLSALLDGETTVRPT